jgi:hypothetical protein
MFVADNEAELQRQKEALSKMKAMPIVDSKPGDSEETKENLEPNDDADEKVEKEFELPPAVKKLKNKETSDSLKSLAGSTNQSLDDESEDGTPPVNEFEKPSNADTAEASDGSNADDEHSLKAENDKGGEYVSNNFKQFFNEKLERLDH